MCTFAYYRFLFTTATLLDGQIRSSCSDGLWKLWAFKSLFLSAFSSSSGASPFIGSFSPKYNCNHTMRSRCTHLQACTNSKLSKHLLRFILSQYCFLKVIIMLGQPCQAFHSDAFPCLYRWRLILSKHV